MNKQIITTVGVAVVSLGVGYGIGYVVTKKRVSAQYEALISEELVAMREDMGRIKKRETFETPGEAVATLLGPEIAIPDEADIEASRKLIEDNQYEEGTIHNIFVDGVQQELSEDEAILINGIPINREDTNDYVVVVDPNHPYVISQLLYHENDSDWDKVSLTYYDGDDTVADDSDRVLDDVDRTIGNINLTKFGEGSNDKDIVYVRNENLGADMEIVRRSGNYTELVLGQAPSQKPDLRKMREGDDN